ncbi:hypothetical protein CMO96_00610 [Candidatus Woesebacteria bacterium]|nr:hypothetical protein [Candidatus Woesebacteria bacterium]
MAIQGKAPQVHKLVVPAMVAILVVVAFMVGVLWQKVSNLEKQGVRTLGETSGRVNPLSADALKTYAKDLGLNEGAFATCFDERKYKSAVEADIKQANDVGAFGTPAFILNGNIISGAQPFSVFQDAIEFELKGGDWSRPDETVADLVDGDINNGEVGVGDIVVELGNAQTKGNKDAKVVLVEFSDFECPFCSRFYSTTLPQIEQNYVDTGKILFAYKHLPLTQIHSNAQSAAEASLCAADQGKFWEYHDRIFQATSGS